MSILSKIKEGDPATFRSIYRDHRAAFLAWAGQRSGMDEDALTDVFQNSVIIMYNNVKSGKLQHLDSSLKTYLFGIAKHLIMRDKDKRNRMPLMDDYQQERISELDTSLEELESLDHKRQNMLKALKSLGDPCQKILHMFYYKQFSIEAIKERLAYKHVDVVRTQKGRCMKKLKNLFEEKYDMLN